MNQQLNPLFQQLDNDYLYHLGLDTTMDLASIFAGIKYVIFSRFDEDAAIIARQFAKMWYAMKEDSFSFQPLYKTERFHLYKIGPIIVVSHGIGMPSMLICLNEIVKLLIHSNNFAVTFFKIGPAGGLGVEVGDIIISQEAVNSKFEPIFTSIECGKTYHYATQLDTNLIQEMLALAKQQDQYKIIVGKTLVAYDYYEEQARLDGALPLPYTVKQQQEYFNQARKVGIKAFDMEMLAFAGFCNQLGIKACGLHIVMVNRLLGDQVTINLAAQLELVALGATIIYDYICHKFK